MRRKITVQSVLIASVLGVLTPLTVSAQSAKPQAAPAKAAPAPAPAQPGLARPAPAQPAPAAPGNTGAGQNSQQPNPSQGRNEPGQGNAGQPPKNAGQPPMNNDPTRGNPDPRVNPIGVNPVNPPAGAGPIGGRGLPTPPTRTGRDTIPNNGQNGITAPGAPGVDDRGRFRDGRGRQRQQPYVIIPNQFAPWGWYNNSGWHWRHGDDYRNYWGQFNENDDRDDSAANTAPPVAPPVAPPIAPATPSPAQDQARAINALEGSPDYRQALAELAKAEEQQTLANRKVMEQLKQNSEYQRLMTKKQAADNRVEAVQASAAIPGNEVAAPAAKVTPAAQVKLDIGSEMTRMEREAIAADPAASAARDRLSQAQQRVAGMRKAAQSAAGG